MGEKREAEDEAEAPPSPQQQTDGKLPSTSKKRSRNGCLNCRRKRRKCSETKPTCEGCQTRGEVCEWGVKVSFRPENAQTVGKEHHSLFRRTSSASRTFQIVDVTNEVARDYMAEPNGDLWDDSQDHPDTTVIEPSPPAAIPEEPSVDQPTPGFFGMSLSQTPVNNGSNGINGMSFLSPHQSENSLFEDGIFLPGSQYQELHAEFRSRLFDTAHSVAPSRRQSADLTGAGLDLLDTAPDLDTNGIAEESRNLAQLTPEQEYTLWQNYITEVAPWMDKFDINRHFELVLPMLAKDTDHLKYSILALSARQIELKERKKDLSCSLALYQHAIHLLTPMLYLRNTAVLASSVVLGVLEMLSCSPKAWRRHLDGCAALIQALGITGTCGGLEQAMFWTFARMDVCGGLISSERTLIPISYWVGGGTLAEDMHLLRAHGTFDMYANQAIYLCGRVIDILCSFGKWEQRSPSLTTSMLTAQPYTHSWLELFGIIETWHRERLSDMRSLLVIPAEHYDPPRPFPTILYPNPPAISGNQMYHTSALLMLKYKPTSLHLKQKPRSMLWHARQICAISISNENHACRTNSVQPIWLAGQLMSHKSEHLAILELYERIEREQGWATKWRANDLKDHWGDLES